MVRPTLLSYLLAMLSELRIRDLAVIEDLSVELAGGLNVLTGETGAGKSIIVGALSLLLGERASSDSVRAGARRATVEAVFELDERPELSGRLRARLDELGLPDEGSRLFLRREVQSEGRNRAWINGSPATASSVGEFGRALVDLHGQHEHQNLLAPTEQRVILDAFGDTTTRADAVRARYDECARLRALRQEREERTREIETRADFLRFQLKEIEDAELRPDEDEEVDVELRRLEHAEELSGETDQVHRSLYARDGSVSEVVADARDRLRRLARLDPGLEELRDQLDSVYHQVVEAGRAAGDYASRIDVEPGRAEQLRKRADLLFRLKRKYGPDLTDVLETARSIRTELDELDEASLTLDELDRELAGAEGALEAAASELTGKRKQAAERLAVAVQEILPDLGMPGARFEVVLRPLEAPGPGGGERVEFLASLNPGFDPQPLAKIASGGELSRVMLALKAILAQVDEVPTLVFDEVDAGIGGTIAAGVARKLEEVARLHQVFVITHLAQVASRGSRHLRVEKHHDSGLASSHLTRLEGEDRVLEISRMLGGDPESPASRDHARELLERPFSAGAA